MSFHIVIYPQNYLSLCLSVHLILTGGDGFLEDETNLLGLVYQLSNLYIHIILSQDEQKIPLSENYVHYK